MNKTLSTNKKLFIMFGIFQTITIGTLIFLLFKALNTINGTAVIGLDTQILLSILTPTFIFIIEYFIYSKK